MSGPDNDSFMLGEECIRSLTDNQMKHYDWRLGLDGKIHPELCIECGRKKRSGYVNDKFILRKKMDYSETYDGFIIVSNKFREFCFSNELTGLHFYELKKYENYFLFDTEKVVNVKLDKEFIKRTKLCSTCNQYSSVAVVGLSLADITEPLTKGIYKTDIEFASSQEMSPAFLISNDLVEKVPSEFDIDFSGITTYGKMVKVWNKK